MIYTTDTHALVWHLACDDRLGKNARAIFNKGDRGEAEIVLPTVVLAEALYISRRGNVSFDLLMNAVRSARNYSVYPLGLNVVQEMRRLGAEYTLHDAVIVATARILDTPVITRDEIIRRLGDVKVIW
ncbi:MAG: PIN domain-containing protein [Thermoplasmata archaeon]